MGGRLSPPVPEARFDWLETWTAPTKAHTPDTPGSFVPAPGGYLGGLGEMQTQHTCILLEDIVETCNPPLPQLLHRFVA